MNSPALPVLISELKFTVHGHGEGQWYAIKTPDERFLRVGRREYFVASCLDAVRTADEIANMVHEIDSGIALTEQEVLTVVGGLTRMGLISSPDNAPAAAPMAKFSFNPIYMKIPLVDGKYLERAGAWLAPLVCLPVLILIGVLWIVAAIGVLANWDWFVSATGKLFVSDSWMWWGLAWLVLKTAHELGHAVTAVRVGSPIRSAGISLIFLAPVPYVDLSDLWAIPNRWQRILCCAGGMLVELVLAASAALVAISTENAAVQYFCCALATMGTVTTLAFNASPLMRFDGYYIFSDLVKYPNLYTDGQLAAKQFVLKCLRPWKAAQQRMTPALVLYGLACYQYRIVIMASLAIGAVLAMQGVGVALVAWGAYAVLIVPLIRGWRARAQQSVASRAAQQAQAIHQVSSGPNRALDDIASVTNDNCETSRKPNSSLGTTTAVPPRGMLSNYGGTVWSAAVVVGLCLLLLFVPAPIQPSIPGYIAMCNPQMIRCESEGFLSEVFVQGGGAVEQGQLIARLSNPELELELLLKRNELATVEETIRLRRAQRQLAELQAYEGERDALLVHIAQLRRRLEGLDVRCTRAGVLVENDLPRMVGLFLKAGEPLAMVAHPLDYEVIASVDQQDVEQMRQAVGETLLAHIRGGRAFTGVLVKVEPRASDRLGEPLLAALYGGPIAAQRQQSARGDEELKLTQPRFDLRRRLLADQNAAVVPGQMVWIRIPGQSATLMDGLGRWCSTKWSDLVKQSRSES